MCEDKCFELFKTLTGVVNYYCDVVKLMERKCALLFRKYGIRCLSLELVSKIKCKKNFNLYKTAARFF